MARKGAAAGLRIAFLHPDLGLGGAERLIVDAACELVGHGHQVDVYTAYYDPSRCFEETRTGGFTVTVAGNWFPRHVFSRLLALCAYIRCTLVALHIALRCRHRGGPAYDAVVVDQVSAVVPFLKLLLPSARVVFYCHFPDLLLAQRSSWLKRAYRAPLDAVEQRTTGMADLLLVNSGFTRRVFAETFSRLHARGARPDVLYPAVAIPSGAALQLAEATWAAQLEPRLARLIGSGPCFLSINRFERKKGIGLAIEALHELLRRRPGCDARLVVAGGYDERLAENREHLVELRRLAEQLGLQEHVRFVPSFTDQQRALLLAACRAVLYTPQHEHFGIVPLEAMAAGRPVLACNSGGPVESVPHQAGGYLCEPTAAAFAAAMAQLLDPAAAAKQGAAAREHVQRSFSRRVFGDRLDAYVRELVAQGRQGGQQQQGGRR
jgi:alpha-1,3/alpha-1,6-mannosyltransferase